MVLKVLLPCECSRGRRWHRDGLGLVEESRIILRRHFGGIAWLGYGRVIGGNVLLLHENI